MGLACLVALSGCSSVSGTGEKGYISGEGNDVDLADLRGRPVVRDPSQDDAAAFTRTLEVDYPSSPLRPRRALPGPVDLAPAHVDADSVRA